MKRILWTLFFAVALLALGTAVVAALNLRGEAALPAESQALSQAVPATPELVARGEYLARAGNCMACHTVQGGAPYAGGRGIDTPFGVIHTTNLTPDKATGIGNWSAAEFWRALHNGRSKDGRLLYPAFPYPNYTQVTREDSDAIYAYLQSLPAVAQANRPHALRFPYNTQAALGVWRALFFTPGTFAPGPVQSAEWNRGAYLVNGLGHCAACHTPRNALGASRQAQAFSGGLIPVQNWYAPALNVAAEAGVAHWPVEDVVALLKTGVAPQGSVTGPMAEVVFRSTQYLNDADAQAIAVYLRALPSGTSPPQKWSNPRPPRWSGVPRCMSNTARNAMATMARASRGLFRPWRATAPWCCKTPPTSCAWCCRVATCRPRRATRARTACRPSCKCWATTMWPRSAPLCATPGATRPLQWVPSAFTVPGSGAGLEGEPHAEPGRVARNPPSGPWQRLVGGVPVRQLVRHLPRLSAAV